MKKGWSEVAFTDIAKLVRREVRVEENGSYPEVGVRCFGKGLFHKLARTGLEVGDKKLFRLKAGDFILQVTFAWEGAVAIVGIEDESLFGSVRVLTFEMDADRCDTRFLLWYFRTAAGVSQLARISPGSAGRNKVLAIGRLGEMRIPLPPLEEQQRIVAHLDAIESRLTRAQKLREDSAKDVEALFPQLLDKAMTPHGEGWRRETLADVIESMDAGWSPQCDKLPAGDGEWGVLKTTSVQWGEFRPQHNKALPSDLVPIPSLGVKEGDVLVTRAGPRQRVGVVAAVRRDEPRMTISDKIIRIRADRTKIHPRFLELSLASPFSQEHLVQRKTGLADAQVNISQSILRATPVAYPALSEQERIVGELDASRRSIEGLAHRQEIVRLELSALLPSLLDRIFNT